MLRILILALPAALAPTDKKPPPTAIAPAQRETDITGFYAVEGRDPNSGDSYSGVLKIDRQVDAKGNTKSVYVVYWWVNDGPPLIGAGLRDGDRFSVSWSMQRDIEGEDGKTRRVLTRGINTYKIGGKAEAPRLDGRWCTLPGTGEIGIERLEFLRPLPREEI